MQLYPAICISCYTLFERTGARSQRCAPCAVIETARRNKLRQKDMRIRRAEAAGRDYIVRDTSKPYVKRKARGELERQRELRGNLPLDEAKTAARIKASPAKHKAALPEAKADKPWLGSGLSVTARFRLRYEHDAEFRARELHRSAANRAKRRSAPRNALDPSLVDG